jgi:transcriptional antiterminator Rof (Rho-off)
MSDYTPVSCALHSHYERLVLARTPLTLRWHDPDGHTREQRVTPRDVVTRAGEEYLVVETAGGCVEEIRLDRIVSPGT